MSNKILNIFNKFGFALRYCLDYERLTQRELAEKLAKHDSQISKWVQNEVTPSRKTRQKINQNIILNINKSHKGWEVTNEHQKVFDKQKIINNRLAIVNEPETPYTTNTATKLDEAREKIITLQEKLIEARDKLLENDKELFDLKDDFIAAQKKILELTDQILELTNQNHTLENKYNSLRKSILSKNIYNMLSDAEFLKEAKKKLNYIPADLVFMFVYGSLLL